MTKTFLFCPKKNACFLSIGNLMLEDKFLLFVSQLQFIWPAFSRKCTHRKLLSSDHEDHCHRQYCWDYLLLYVRTLHDPLMVSQNIRRDKISICIAPRRVPESVITSQKSRLHNVNGSLRIEGCYIEQTSPMWYLSWNHGTNRKKGNSKQARVESWTWIYLYGFYDTSHLITMIYRRGTNINCSTRYCRQFLIF